MIAAMKYVMCDGCGAPAEFGDDAKEARAQALREGFARVEGRDYCPACKSCKAVTNGEPLPCRWLDCPRHGSALRKTMMRDLAESKGQTA